MLISLLEKSRDCLILMNSTGAELKF